MDSDSDQKKEFEEDICIHIFTVSSAMVGVCLTVIGLIRVVITLGKANTLADDLLAGDALLFLISCFLSYAALRARGLRRMHRIERTADAVFIRNDPDGRHLRGFDLRDLYPSNLLNAEAAIAVMAFRDSPTRRR